MFEIQRGEIEERRGRTAPRRMKERGGTVPAISRWKKTKDRGRLRARGRGGRKTRKSLELSETRSCGTARMQTRASWRYFSYENMILYFPSSKPARSLHCFARSRSREICVFIARKVNSTSFRSENRAGCGG